MNDKQTGGLLARTAKGAGWVVGWRMATRTLGLISTLTMARLLIPADFGLVALGTGFAQALDAFSMLGVQDAVVREKAPTPELYNTAFTMNAIRGCTTATLIEAFARPMAAFYGDPRLVNILHVLAIAMLASACENIGILEFRRNLTFDKEFKLFVLPRIAGVLLAIASAALLRSYWALVIGILSTRTLRCVLSYTMHPFRPRLTLRSWRKIAGFSAWSWAISIVALICDKLDSFTIGRVLSVTSVGEYALGAEIATLPATELVDPVSRACFSSFSVARHAGMGVAETYLRVAAATFTLTLPAGVGLALVADPLVKLALGAHWVAAIPVLRILALCGSAAAFSSLGLTLLSAQGTLRPIFGIVVTSLVTRAVLLTTLTAPFGLSGAAAAVGASKVLDQALSITAAFRQFDLRPRHLLEQTWRTALAAAVMAAVMVASGEGWTRVDGTPRELALHLLGAVSLGTAVFGIALLALWAVAGRPKSGPEADALGLLRRLLQRLPGLPRSRRSGVMRES